MEPEKVLLGISRPLGCSPAALPPRSPLPPIYLSTRYGAQEKRPRERDEETNSGACIKFVPCWAALLATPVSISSASSRWFVGRANYILAPIINYFFKFILFFIFRKVKYLSLFILTILLIKISYVINGKWKRDKLNTYLVNSWYFYR